MEEDFDEEDENFEDEDELKENEIIAIESKRGGGKAPTKPQQPQRANKPITNKDRFVAFKQEEVVGILDRKTNQQLVGDPMVLFAIIISKLNRLEEGLL